VASSITLAPVMTSPATAGALGLRSTARLGLAPGTPLVLALPTDPSNVLIHRAFTARVSLALGIPLGLASPADPRDLRRLNCSSLALGCHLYCSVLSVFPRSEWIRFHDQSILIPDFNSRVGARPFIRGTSTHSSVSSIVQSGNHSRSPSMRSSRASPRLG